MKPKTGFPWKKLGLAVGVLVAALMVAALVYRRELTRLYTVIHFFEPEVIVENFRTTDRIFDTRPVRRAGPVHRLMQQAKPLPPTVAYWGRTQPLSDWIEATGTTGLIVIHRGAVAFERYYQGNDEKTRAISWSVGKSFVSALVGFALQEGKIASIADPVTRYVPALKGTGYDGVPIRHVLQMSSGIGFNEDYGDFDSDINRMGRTFALATPMDDFVASLKNQHPPGTRHHYVSMDTQVLGMVLREATGSTLSAYMDYNNSGDEMETESLAVFRSIARHLDL